MGMCPACSRTITEKDVRNFFIKRFGHLPEQDEMYYNEWKERLMGWGKGRAPEDYMEKTTSRAWHETMDNEDEIHYGSVVSDGKKEWRVLELEDGKVRLQLLNPPIVDGEPVWEEQHVTVKALQTFERIEE